MMKEQIEAAGERGPKRREERAGSDLPENDRPGADSRRSGGSSEKLPPPGIPVEKQTQMIPKRLDEDAAQKPGRIEYGRPHERGSG